MQHSNLANNERAVSVIRCLAPRVLLVCSSQAEALAAKNGGIRLAQLLRAFCSTPLRASYELESETRLIAGFNYNVCDARDLAVADDSVALYTELTGVVARHTSQAPFGDVELRTAEDVAQLVEANQDESVSPWFLDFACDFVRRAGSKQVHEFFSQPVACLVVVSSQSEDPVGEARALFDPAKLPPDLFAPGFEPASLDIHYVVLHDDHEGPTQSAAAKHEQMGAVFGASHAHLLKINSADHLTPLPRSHLACFLSPEDVEGMAQFSSSLALDVVVPQIVRRLRQTSEKVAQKKGRGWSFLWGKSNAEPEERPAGGMKHALSSAFMLYRLQGDMAFFLQHYELAIMAYRAAAKEVKRDADEYLAGALEMAALSSFLANTASPRDLVRDLDHAFQLYGNRGLGLWRTRNGLFGAMVHQSFDNYIRGGTLFSDIADHEDPAMVKALFQEQAALCLLHLQPPRYRRFAFRLVFAARKYAAAKLLRHAVRCYRVCYGMYRERGWHLIDDHLIFALGRQLSLAEQDKTEARALFEALLLETQQTEERQAAYLREYLYICEQHNAAQVDAGVSEQQLWRESRLPCVLHHSARVVFYRDSEAEAPMSEAFALLEKSLARFGSRLHHRRSVSRVVRSNAPSRCAIGEAIRFEVQLRNPLALPMQLAQCHLNVAFEPLPGVKDADDGGESAVPHAAWQCEMLDVVLGAQGVVTVAFSVTPLKMGLLKIRGIRCLLCNKVPVILRIEPGKLRLNVTQAQRQGKVYEERRRLDLQVMGPMPLLQAQLLEFPALVSLGEVRRAQLVIRNVGNTPMKNLRIKMSHPAFTVLSVQREDDANLSNDHDNNNDNGSGCDAAQQWEQHVGEEERTVLDDAKLDNTLRDVSVYEVPLPGEALAVGDCITLTLWVRGQEVGTYACLFLLYYEAAGKRSTSAAAAHRTFRLASTLIVEPSLLITCHTWPTPSSVHASVLRTTVQNVSSEAIQLQQVETISKWWAPQRVVREDAPGLLLPGTSLTILIHLDSVLNATTFDMRCAYLKDAESERVDLVHSPLLPLLMNEKNEQVLDTHATALQSKRASRRTTPLLAENSLHLVVYWTRSNERRGLHVMYDVPLLHTARSEPRERARSMSVRAASPMLAKSTALRCSTKITRLIVHDFSSALLCTATAEVVVFNPGDAEVAFVLRAERHEPEASSALSYLWAGAETHVATLHAKQAKTMRLTAVFSRPGLYNLNRFSVVVGERAVQEPEEYMVEVRDSKNG